MNETKQVAQLYPTDVWIKRIVLSLIFWCIVQGGAIFIRSLNTSSIHKNVGQLFTLLDSIMDEIGEENVVQIATDSPSAYVAAGKMLMEKKKKQLFWYPSAAHWEVSWTQRYFVKGRKVIVYIYKHGWILNLMRDQTNRKELIRPSVIRIATASTLL